MKNKINLDNNATTALDPSVAEKIAYHLKYGLGNPSSIHQAGRDARALLIEAQNIIAKHLEFPVSSILFTSGGTESINMFLKGYPIQHIISSNQEHAASESCLEYLEKRGVPVTRVNPGKRAINADDIQQALRQETNLIALIAANNETGVVHDIESIAALANERNIPVVLDAIAWWGKKPLPKLPGKVAWCLSGHKIHGPSGIGLAIFPKNLIIQPLLSGGPQQNGRRGGTENLLGILGLAKAVDRLHEVGASGPEHMLSLRKRFEEQLASLIPDIAINGEGERLCNTSNIVFEGVDGESLLFLLDQEGVYASMGSACSSGALEPSRVLLNMGYDRKRVLSSLRFSFCRNNSAEEVDAACEIIKKIVLQLRRG